MGFTVMRPGGTKDSEFQAYVRVLRQRGVDIGKLPRVPEPGTGRRWLYVWPTEEDARSFADELRQRTRDGAWEVVETTTPPSEGPLGPILIQLARRADGLVIALHPLSRAMLRTAYPQATPAATDAFISAAQWFDFQRTTGGLKELVEQIAPSLTGLSPEDFLDLGYAVIDAGSEDTLVYSPPALPKS